MKTKRERLHQETILDEIMATMGSFFTFPLLYLHFDHYIEEDYDE